VHIEFYEKLQSKFPDLTTNERKLCAFLRLNMTTKEISAITNQSLNSIEMARHRLRKKLNIDNSQVNLTTFLMDL
jgi:DNA-binding CsgD family transcriptional regulator